MYIIISIILTLEDNRKFIERVIFYLILASLIFIHFFVLRHSFTEYHRHFSVTLKNNVTTHHRLGNKCRSAWFQRYIYRSNMRHTRCIKWCNNEETSRFGGVITSLISDRYRASKRGDGPPTDHDRCNRIAIPISLIARH